LCLRLQLEHIALQFRRSNLTAKCLRELARRRETFAFESTLASRFYASWIAELEQQDYEFYLFFIWLRSPELAMRRVEERVNLGGHSIESETIRRRYGRGLKNFFALYQPLADSWTVYDNSSGESPTLIADRETGAPIQMHDAVLWEMVCDLKSR
jgi:predicted ABC-type ATPase